MTDYVGELAGLLLAARRDPARRITSLPGHLVPATMAQALAVQHAVAAELGPIGGWKVGAPGGVRVCGALPAATIQASPARLDAGSHRLRIVESEIAFRLRQALPPRGQPYTRTDVVGAIGTMHPVIEVCESRFVEPKNFDMLTSVADLQSHGGLVHGAAVTDWQRVDLAAQRCQQFINDAVSAERTGYPFGDIIDLVLWLANEGSVWAGGIAAGQFVTCGSWSGALRAPAGATVRASFPGVGDAQVTYA